MPKAWKIIIAVYLGLTVIFYSYYFFFKETKLDTVYKNWDGPSYVITAISLYNPQIAYDNNFIQSTDIKPTWTWLPAHFPLYPWLIRASSAIGYFPAMLLISQIFSLATFIAFYEFVRRIKLTNSPLPLTLLMMLLPPRWFIVSHIGASEPIFLFFMLLMLLFWHQKKHLTAAIFGAVAQLARPQGILLFAAVGLFALYEMIVKKMNIYTQLKTYLPYFLIPASLLGVFVYFYFRTGDFFAFFSAISIFKHTQILPFTVFTYPAPNVETYWQEINAVNYVVYLASIFVLFRRRLFRLGILGLIFFLPLPFLRHSDISRYALPLMPLAFIAFEDLLSRREFVLAAYFMSPAIMAYAVNFMTFNRTI
ncbi:MAG: hypothetical protein ABII21_04305 [bacterium]